MSGFWPVNCCRDASKSLRGAGWRDDLGVDVLREEVQADAGHGDDAEKPTTTTARTTQTQVLTLPAIGDPHRAPARPRRRADRCPARRASAPGCASPARGGAVAALQREPAELDARAAVDPATARPVPARPRRSGVRIVAVARRGRRRACSATGLPRREYAGRWSFANMASPSVSRISAWSGSAGPKRRRACFQQHQPVARVQAAADPGAPAWRPS